MFGDLGSLGGGDEGTWFEMVSGGIRDMVFVGGWETMEWIMRMGELDWCYGIRYD